MRRQECGLIYPQPPTSLAPDLCLPICPSRQIHMEKESSGWQPGASSSCEESKSGLEAHPSFPEGPPTDQAGLRAPWAQSLGLPCEVPPASIFPLPEPVVAMVMSQPQARLFLLPSSREQWNPTSPQQPELFLTHLKNLLPWCIGPVFNLQAEKKKSEREKLET